MIIQDKNLRVKATLKKISCLKKTLCFVRAESLYDHFPLYVTLPVAPKRFFIYKILSQRYCGGKIA